MPMLWKVVSRDGPMCHICGLCCDLRQRPASGRIVGTRDHIIPASVGGTSRIYNLRLAHQYCNAKRSALDIDDALRDKCRTWILKNHQFDIVAAEEWWVSQKNRYVMPDNIRIKLMGGGYWERSDPGVRRVSTFGC